ncbi:hypothetical protein PR202_ga30426 [Eleusine coracana subsp. coracana]|uniref:Uncharacterized protein n=1 Tax=Eleusine coracana subsp. coracana TaxID=191504 RepID=A0AAV5DPR9_ELECO|nr:hypothetical protein PR202_ga30426 [Eleusine coracana subsp. coracana]
MHAIGSSSLLSVLWKPILSGVGAEAMATLWSGSHGPAAAAPAPAVADEQAAKQWAPHDTVLTACVVSINILVILLIIFFFWRFFCGKPDPSSAGAEDDDNDDALPVASPWATRRYRRREAPPRQPLDVAKALPVYVYSSAGEGGKPAECAVCIVELKDGDSAVRPPVPRRLRGHMATPPRHVSALARRCR